MIKGFAFYMHDMSVYCWADIHTLCVDNCCASSDILFQIYLNEHRRIWSKFCALLFTKKVTLDQFPANFTLCLELIETDRSMGGSITSHAAKGWNGTRRAPPPPPSGGGSIESWNSAKNPSIMESREPRWLNTVVWAALLCEWSHHASSSDHFLLYDLLTVAFYIVAMAR
jgi:hypothetical protein